VKTILITGATSGIGLEAAVVLSKQGHRLLLVGRDARKMTAAAARVPGAVTYLCDFGSQAQIRRLAAEVRSKHERIDVLVNNAGLVTKQRELTEDGIERIFAVNHLAYFLLTKLLLDRVGERVVNVSSVGHYRGTLNLEDPGFERGGWSILRAYQRSKLCNVLFTRALMKRGVKAIALHPGDVSTPIWDKTPGWFHPVVWVFKAVHFISVEEGGANLVNAVLNQELTSGVYVSEMTPKEPSRLALDEALAERLWALSEQMIGSVPAGN
jgi:NAD(P)-dependent dehydrogenase (short-subunit alcohol dehydrogenase family)